MFLIGWLLTLLMLQAEFLAAAHRNTSSEYYDLYYCCNVCGGGILWIVDGEDAAIHRMTSSPGNVDFYRYPVDPATLRYASVVLSRWRESLLRFGIGRHSD